MSQQTKYQENPYLKTLRTKVLSCAPVPNTSQFDVVFEDTIVFPVGGGQPCDKAQVEETEVIDCFRQEGNITHRVTSALEQGREVEIKLDWNRRKDHMQQHSGQHLISALAEQHFAWDTVSWNLGAEKCSIDVACKKPIDAQQLQELEELANDQIKKQLPISVTLYEKGDPELEKVYSRGNLEEVTGSVRVISIGEIDRNPCCGTHLRNTSELLSIKLLYFEKFKANFKIFFVVGDRVRVTLGSSYGLQRQLQIQLSAPPTEFLEKVGDLQKAHQSDTKKVKSLLEEVAHLQGSQAGDAVRKGERAVVCHHREDGTVDYINAYQRGLLQIALNAKKPKIEFDYLVMLSVGDKEGGMLVLSGPQNVLEGVVPKITELTGAKGKVINGEFRAKLLTCTGIVSAQKYVAEFKS